MNEISLANFARDQWPVSTISLILISSGFLKVSIICGLLLRFQERRIKFLEEQLEDSHK